MLLTYSSASGETFDNLVKRDGLWYKKFTNIPFTGEINEGTDRGNVEDGKLTGVWEFYFPDGQLEVKVHMKNGLRDGLAERYWQNGQLDFVGKYKNDKKDGAWKYYNSDGRLWSMGEYQNEKKEGVWSNYFPNGQLNNIGEYRNNKKEGPWKYYSSKTSKLWLKNDYKNGLIHGISE